MRTGGLGYPRLDISGFTRAYIQLPTRHWLAMFSFETLPLCGDDDSSVAPFQDRSKWSQAVLCSMGLAAALFLAVAMLCYSFLVVAFEEF